LNVIRLDPWNGAVPLILIESRSLAGVVRALTRDYAAMIAPTNGQTAAFLHNDVAPRMSERTRVLYLGDYDKGGSDIEGNTRRVLERYHDLEGRWERLMLTREQVDFYELTVIEKYGRDKQFHDSVETEALSQSVIVQTVRARLNSLLPEPLEGLWTREEDERERLRALIARAQ
jgi:hypothetical protein